MRASGTTRKLWTAWAGDIPTPKPADHRRRHLSENFGGDFTCYIRGQAIMGAMGAGVEVLIGHSLIKQQLFIYFKPLVFKHDKIHYHV